MANRTQSLRSVALRWLALWSRAGIGGFDAMHTESFVDHSSGGRAPTRDGFRSGNEALLAAFPDFEVTAEDVVVDGTASKVAIRWTALGTHAGPYMGYAPTGKTVRFAGIEIIRTEGDKVTDRWGEWDADSLREQLATP